MMHELAEMWAEILRGYVEADGEGSWYVVTCDDAGEHTYVTYEECLIAASLKAYNENLEVKVVTCQ